MLVILLQRKTIDGDSGVDSDDTDERGHAVTEQNIHGLQNRFNLKQDGRPYGFNFLITLNK